MAILRYEHVFTVVNTFAKDKIQMPKGCLSLTDKSWTWICFEQRLIAADFI